MMENPELSYQNLGKADRLHSRQEQKPIRREGREQAGLLAESLIIPNRCLELHEPPPHVATSPRFPPSLITYSMPPLGDCMCVYMWISVGNLGPCSLCTTHLEF